MASPACGGRVVTLAGLNWESGEFLTALTREMLERGFGCRTETLPGNTVTLEQALANDDVQIIAEEWVDRSEVWRRAVTAGKVRAVGHPFAGGGEGWAIPDYVVHGDPARHIAATAPGLTRVDQLADPKYMALFRDPEQPGRGRFLNCPSGWTCEDENTTKLRAYGLNAKYVDFRPGTGAAMDAEITAAEAQGRPLLFYYWSPSTIAGKFRLTHLAEPPYDPACWARMHAMTTPGGGGCASPPGTIAFGVSPRFATDAPDVVAFLARATLSPDILNSNLAAMSRDQRAPRVQATRFLRDAPEVWRAWVTPAVAARITASLDAAPLVAAPTPFPARFVVSIRGPVNAAVAALVAHDGGVFRAISQALLSVIVALDNVLDVTPWWLLIGVLMVLAWAGTRRVWLSMAIGALMFGVGVLGLWALMLQTLTLMLIASALALALGLPIGLAVAKSRWTRRIVSPLLDVMQTMPSFVYLIPALMLFGLGKVPAILATVIYAVPPMIRLTALGVEQVDPEVREAATSFGVSPMRLLLTVELPLALPSAMAGVNQTIMLALSMVVVASMIGARGLGEQVLNGIQMLDVGQGLEAGLGIVALAVVLDRITQGFGARRANV